MELCALEEISLNVSLKEEQLTRNLYSLLAHLTG